MIQFGQNAGPWHLHFYGLVNNIKRKSMTPTERQIKDKQILGVFGLSWALFQSVMPKQVTDACDAALLESNMPSMTYQGDMEGIVHYAYIVTGLMVKIICRKGI